MIRIFRTVVFALLLMPGLLLAPVAGQAAPLAPNLKVLLCTGDYGMWAQDRVPAIKDAVEKASPGANVAWESHQSFNFTKVLESAGFAQRFDVVVMGDIAIGQLTPRAQQNLVEFVNNGGGLVYAMWAKSTLPFKGSEDAVPMPLKTILPVAYPDLKKPAAGASTLASTDAFFNGIDFSAITDEGARKNLDHFLIEGASGKGKVLALYGAFGPSWNRIKYATHEKAPGGWGDFPQLGEIWTRVLNRAAQSSPVRSQSRAQMDAKIKAAPLTATVSVDATKTVDEIRAANFSVVALQQLYNEDGGAGENLFLALNPRDWFDRRTQEVLPNTKGVKADKPAFFREYNIKGIYMGENSYGSYGNWDEAKYQEQITKAVDDKKKWPEQLTFFQAGNEPPLDENYIKFHDKFVDGVLAAAPDYKVVGPNKAFNLLGVDPREMQFYIDRAGKTTDVLNWHTYAQPPSTVLAEARYWSDQATGKLRSPGPAKVMFTESDAWNTGDSQFNYLMLRAFTFLPEPRIIANFQYCMRPRSEGGPYKFGVLQPDGEMEANYNGYWAWRNLRGQMTETTINAPNDEAKNHVHAISSRSDDGKTFTTVVYYDTGYFDGNAGSQAKSAHVTVAPKLPAGEYSLEISDITWNERATREGKADAPVSVTLAPCQAVALTWTRR